MTIKSCLKQQTENRRRGWRNGVHSQYRNKIFKKPCTLIIVLNHSEFNKHTNTIQREHQLFFMATTSRKKLLIANHKNFIKIVGSVGTTRNI